MASQERGTCCVLAQAVLDVVVLLPCSRHHSNRPSFQGGPMIGSAPTRKTGVPLIGRISAQLRTVVYVYLLKGYIAVYMGPIKIFMTWTEI